MKRWLGPLGVAFCALALSSCTLVATNTSPVRIPGKVPFSLLSPTIPGTNHARVRFQGLAVYFVDATNNLTATSRIVPYPPVLSTVVEQLILGPTSIEHVAGYSSYLPKKLVLLSANVRGQIGYVNFATSLNKLSREKQILAVGQLVLTAYEVGATKGIVIKVAGVTQHLVTPSGPSVTLATLRSFAPLLNG
ncbi:MAG TPA: GerMN domain-containing protein [Acidimicrobiales bacterium]